MTTDHVSPPTLAGYRLVRRLGVGSRAEVFLGVAAADQGEAARTAVLKVFRHDLDPADAGRELDALGRVKLPHSISLLDVANGPSGLPVPILSRVQRGSIAQLLTERDSIEAGEAVTILAPLPPTLTELHTAGVAHSALSAASIHLGGAGEPVLIGFGHATLFAGGLSIAALDEVPAVIAERDRLARTAVAVLDRVRPGVAATRLRELKAWLESSAGSRRYEFAAELEERLFDLAASIPIQFATVPAASIAVPARIGEPSEATAAESVSPSGSRRHRAIPTRGRRAAGRTSSSLLQDAIMTNPLETVRARLLRFTRGVRKPLWFAIGGVAMALVLALALVPQDRAASVSRPQAPAPPAVGNARHFAHPSAVTDDPVAALGDLLADRSRCVRERSVICLDSVDENGSSAQRDDSAPILAIRSGGEIPTGATISSHQPRLLERLGDSALVSLGANSDPASVLMIRSKAGWRLRSYLSGQPVKR